MDIVKTLMLVLSMLLVSNTSLANPYPFKDPVFKFWYGDAEETSKPTDSCGKDEYQYTDKAGSVDEAKQNFINSLPKHDNCVWQNVSVTQNDSEPEDFPLMSETGEAWPDFIHAHPEFRSFSVSASCIDDQHLFVDYKSKDFYGSYACLPGTTVIELDDDKSEHCYVVKDYACLSDVSGRDMTAPVVGPLGHLALTSPTNFTMHPKKIDAGVIQVEPYGSGVNARIQTDTMDNFIHAAPDKYWGTRYQLKNTPLFDMLSAIKVIKYAIAQQAFVDDYMAAFVLPERSGGSVLKYTLDKSLNVIGKNILQNARYRCDTFIVEAYKKGAGLDVTKQVSGIIRPWSVFNAFVNTRETTPKFGFANGRMCPVSSPKDDVVKEFSSDPLDLNAASQALNAYVESQQATAEVKINFILSLMKNYSNDITRFSLLVNGLVPLRPYAATNDLINIYNSEQGTDFKTVLVGLFNEMVYLNTKSDIEALSDSDKNNIVRLEQLISSSANRETVGAGNFNSVINAMSVSSAIEYIYQHFAQLQSNNLSKKMIYVAAYNKIFSSNNQTESFNEFQSKIQMLDRDDTVRARALCYYLNSESPGHVAKVLRPKIRNILYSYKSQLSNPNFKQFLISDVLWLDALAKVSTDNHADLISFEETYINRVVNSQSDFVSAVYSIKPDDMREIANKSGLLSIRHKFPRKIVRYIDSIR